ncbi:YccF domain-containing protein [Bacteroides sp. OttesenSCG-928-E20]|nr:YccF domain-containing protein [Bacteroides sp. OttesenSCG-928-E20]MDL2304422.1 YccF domain-containing protein [Bacteroides sp. OttesenSCG-928-D19]
MNLLLNILWLLLGGILTCIEYMLASIVLMITIIGIPFGIQTFKMAFLALMPFGKEVRTAPASGGCLSVLMNVIWILFGGIWICISHLAFGVVLFITIIGIPFALQHFKLAALALTPFGKEVINKR